MKIIEVGKNHIEIEPETQLEDGLLDRWSRFKKIKIYYEPSYFINNPNKKYKNGGRFRIEHSA